MRDKNAILMRLRVSAMALRHVRPKTQAKKSPRMIGGLNPYQWRHGGDKFTVPEPLVQRNILLAMCLFNTTTSRLRHRQDKTQLID
jgi:hypothetical protein